MVNSIKGTIYDPFTSPVSNMKIRAFDRDLRTETLLGEASLVNTEDYINAFVRGINIILPIRARGLKQTN